MTHNKIKKLIVPLAGLGTRFLPTSKNCPKEMAHLVDKPVIQYIVEEACQSGIQDIIFVITPSKALVRDYFSDNFSSQQKNIYDNSVIAQKNLSSLRDLGGKVNFHFIKKNITRGDGHSILLAKSFIATNEAFAISMGDLLSPPRAPFLKQLIDIYNKIHQPVISVERVPLENTEKFGVIVPTHSDGRLHVVGDLIEKPGPLRAPSNIAMTGKYIVNASIFPYLARIVRKSQSEGNEPRLADALKMYSQTNHLYAYECRGLINDTGNKLDFLKTTVRFGLDNSEYGRDFRIFLKSLL